MCQIFLLIDVIKCRNLSVKYCPTERMWAKILTNPLQGKPFRRMQSKLMKMPEIYVKEDQVTPKSVSTTKTSTAGVALPGTSTKTKTTGVAQQKASVAAKAPGVQP